VIVGINGIGRIGRALIRASVTNPAAVIGCVNDTYPSDDNLLYLLERDSAYGRLPAKLGRDSYGWQLDGESIARYSRAELNEVPWAQHGVGVVLDASGTAGRSVCDAVLASGVGAVVLARHVDWSDLEVIPAVNDGAADERRPRVISASTCDGVALATTLAALAPLQIASGTVLTLHPWLADQHLLDGPLGEVNFPQEYGLGRAATISVIPRSTSVLSVLTSVYPEIAARLMSMSYRVPTYAVSSVNLSLQLGEPVTPTDVADRLSRHALLHPEILALTDENVVSIDMLGAPSAVTIDARWTEVSADGTLLRLLGWYDNELGYAQHVLRIAQRVAE
jgi:glyceraldehyde 3-phosphate dehydrogenase